MKIALLTLTRGSVSGGFRKYLHRLVPLLRQHPDVECVRLFMPPQMATKDDATWPANDEMRGFVELRKSIAALRPDVIFIPTSRVLRVGDFPVVTMVRNMEPLEVPFGGNTIAEAVKNLFRAAAARAACRRSTRVIAVSRHVREFLVNRWQIPKARIGTVSHGIDPIDAVPARIPATLASMPEGRFLFTAGSIRPARGLEDLIVAASNLPDDLRIVIAGSVDRGAEGYAAKMRRLAADRGVSSRITWAGQLDADGISWCFRNAALFVITSRAEACPNVVLEALAHGTLSVSTNHAPMPEFFDDAALYYRQRDAQDLASRVVEALALAATERSRLRERSIARAASFTWEDTARGTVRELQAAMEAPQSASFI